MQKEERLGKTVAAPTKKAIPLVTDVTVMDTPYKKMHFMEHYTTLCYTTQHTKQRKSKVSSCCQDGHADPVKQWY